MCWAMRIAQAEIPADNPATYRPYIGQSVTAGEILPALTMSKSGPLWRELRFGMMFRESVPRLIWNAKAETLEEVQRWYSHSRQRCTIPVSAYADKTGANERWFSTETAWLIGIYDPEKMGGVAVITIADGDDRLPVLVTKDDAMTWLKAQPWEAFPFARTVPRLAAEPLRALESEQP